MSSAALSARLQAARRSSGRTLAVQQRVAYSVDQGDRLVSVCPAWRRFAEENDAHDLAPETVVGESLFSFVAGVPTQELYSMILSRVRDTEQQVVLPFRCDSPRLRRFMELNVAPGAAGRLDFEARTLKLEPRVEVPLLDPLIERSDELVTICGWCKRVDTSGEWLEVELAVERLGLFDAAAPPQLSHGICRDCATEMERRMEERTRTRASRRRPAPTQPPRPATLLPR